MARPAAAIKASRDQHCVQRMERAWVGGRQAKPLSAPSGQAMRSSAWLSRASWLVVPIPEGKVAKNRIHLDVHDDDSRTAEVDRLVNLGAQLLGTPSDRDL